MEQIRIGEELPPPAVRNRNLSNELTTAPYNDMDFEQIRLVIINKIWYWNLYGPDDVADKTKKTPGG